MNTIQIHETTEQIQSESGKMTSYKALNHSGKGKMIATVTGPIIKTKSRFGSDMIEMESDRWALRDILAFAQRGEHGLTLA